MYFCKTGGYRAETGGVGYEGGYRGSFGGGNGAGGSFGGKFFINEIFSLHQTETDYRVCISQ